jgi:energy-coupling factor transporter ATP-binding protein EcfA2
LYYAGEAMIFADDVELALALACEELQMTRDEIIRLILREWLEQYGFIQFHELDEGSDTNSSA